MSALVRIRKDVFSVTQAEMGVIAGVPQATISRWEAGLLEPSLTELARIRSEALRRGVAWDDSWFFHRATDAEHASKVGPTPGGAGCASGEAA